MPAIAPLQMCVTPPLSLLAVFNLGAVPAPAAITSVAQSNGATLPTGSVQAPLPSSISPTAVTDSAQGGLLLSPSSEVIPQKLLNKIRSKKFLDMKELLQDNMSLVAQLEELQGPTSLHVVGATRPRMREITSLPTWCHCFLAYAAAMTSDPVTRDHLAYMRLIIQQAQRQNGLGWMDYDKAFRQQVAADPTMKWNAINPGLLTSTMLGPRQSAGPNSFCTLCRAVDHTRQQCALAFLEPPPAPQRLPPPPPPRRQRPYPVCYAWNRGSCPYGSRCNFRHVCLSCSSSSHKSGDCPQAPSAQGERTPSTRGR